MKEQQVFQQVRDTYLLKALDEKLNLIFILAVHQ